MGRISRYLLLAVIIMGSISVRAQDGDVKRMEAILRANHGTRSGHERTPQAKFCLTNVFLPGEYGDNEEIWLEFMSSVGSSFLPFQGGEWWRLDVENSRLEFRFDVHGEKEFVSYSFDPATLRFISGFIRNVRTPAEGLACEF